MFTRTKLKGVLCLILCAALIAALTGCGGGGKTENSPPPETESSPDTPPTTSETPETSTPPVNTPDVPPTPIETPQSVTPVTAIFPNPLDTVSFYDSNFYYQMNPGYKVWYISQNNGPAQQLMDQSFAHWASLMNVEYGGLVCSDDNGIAFLELLAQYVSDGADGLLIDPDSVDYASAAQMLDEAGIPWMSVLSMPRDYAAEDTPLLHPYITGQYQLTGTPIAGKLFAIKDELWPDVPFEKIALLLVGPEVSGAVSGNIQEVTEAWISRTGLAESCFAMAVNGASTEAVLTDTLALTADFEYYLIYVYSEYHVDAVNNVLDINGLAPNSAIISVATESDTCRELMFIRWENSQQNALEAMMIHPATLHAEAALGALYAFMSGTAAPETIWPAWINQNDKGGEGGTYAAYAVPYFWLEAENYKHILKWTDMYSGADFFPDYPSDGVTRYDYEQWRGVPEEYVLRQVEQVNDGDAETADVSP